jgi:Ion channel
MSRGRSCRRFWRFKLSWACLLALSRAAVGDTVYFTFVTGLTIGYGDIVPRQALARALAIGIGISGLFLTGLIAGIAVYAMRTALIEDRRTD